MIPLTWTLFILAASLWHHQMAQHQFSNVPNSLLATKTTIHHLLDILPCMVGSCQKHLDRHFTLLKSLNSIWVISKDGFGIDSNRSFKKTHVWQPFLSLNRKNEETLFKRGTWQIVDTYHILACFLLFQLTSLETLWAIEIYRLNA